MLQIDAFVLEAGTQWLEPAFGALFKWGTYAALISFRHTTECDRWQTAPSLYVTLKKKMHIYFYKSPSFHEGKVNL